MMERIALWAMTTFGRAQEDEEGQALVEYGLLLFLIAVVCVTVIGLLGGKVSSVFNNIYTNL